MSFIVEGPCYDDVPTRTLKNGGILRVPYTEPDQWTGALVLHVNAA